MVEWRSARKRGQNGDDSGKGGAPFPAGPDLPDKTEDERSRLPSKLRASTANERGSVAINTRENSMKVYRLSITLWLAFEWSGKSLKRPGLDGRDAKSAFTGWKVKRLVGGVQGIGMRDSHLAVRPGVPPGRLARCQINPG